ncbi:endonuclease/exonuclease/phosphatase family protein [Rhizobium alvei]|uniref:Endonuclease n=1 Tax=Rhizobium alvei TaxID=1132659 RepID=A0ABT8YPQ4_9HYPH|nr:endonuclease/exonuclease/phosphatase family protein [Rhizobium alvei]MDO6965609.1 endonuclease [Rhizobium alvei]
MLTTTTNRLPAPPADLRSRLDAKDKTIEAHDALMASLPAMSLVETDGSSSKSAALSFPITVSAWNLERCLFVEASARRIAETRSDVVLLSEMDCGMARTGQRHTSAELARELDMTYSYGVEFIELGLGSPIERDLCTDSFNALGFHGNALLAKANLHAPFMIRLEGERLWRNHDPNQPRIGERCAVGATIESEDGPILFVSVHLESAVTAPYREWQVKALLDVIDAHFPALPVLIGGDMNTGNRMEGDFEAEGLFPVAFERGYRRHGGDMTRMTTRASLISRFPERAMKLDWFLSRDLDIDRSSIVAAVDEQGRPLSDHELITCRIAGITGR